MDKLPTLGNDLLSQVGSTPGVYAPLLTANAAAIRQTERKTFQYGPDARHSLDVYYPATPPTPTTPILLFSYGGGLVRGSKQLPLIPDGLVYANIGHFFASAYGMQVVIADYRLVGPPDVKYPSGGEDIGLAIKWIGTELARDSPRQLFCMGNSAGGIHLSTWLLDAAFLEQHRALKTYGKGLQLKGIIMVGVPFDSQTASPGRMGVLEAYYGHLEREHCPLGLLEGLLARVAGPVPMISTLIVYSELDPEGDIMLPNRRFIDAWPDRSKLDVLELVGHNHISTALSLGTGIAKEEAWGRQVAEWIASKCTA